MAVTVRLAFNKSKEAQKLCIERLAASMAPLTTVDAESFSRELPELAHIPGQVLARRRLHREYEEEQCWLQKSFEKLSIAAEKSARVFPISPAPTTPATKPKKEEEQPPL